MKRKYGVKVRVKRKYRGERERKVQGLCSERSAVLCIQLVRVCTHQQCEAALSTLWDALSMGTGRFRFHSHSPSFPSGL